MYVVVLLDKAVHITQTRRTRDHACHPSTWEVGTGGSEAEGHLQLYSEFKASLSYRRVRKNGGGKEKKKRERTNLAYPGTSKITLEYCFANQNKTKYLSIQHAKGSFSPSPTALQTSMCSGGS